MSEVPLTIAAYDQVPADIAEIYRQLEAQRYIALNASPLQREAAWRRIDHLLDTFNIITQLSEVITVVEVVE